MRRSVTARHTIILQLLVSFLREAGLQPIPEARTEDGERPDLRLFLDGCPLLLDVSVTHPFSPSALSRGVDHVPLGLLGSVSMRRSRSMLSWPRLKAPPSFLWCWNLLAP